MEQPTPHAHTADDAARAAETLAAVRPSARQLRWQSMEFYAFIHFGMNTMTNREWGLGDEVPALFDPAAVDVDQWMAAIKSARMTGVILTAKHHDGFCLWPSKHTAHSVANSPWRGGSGDLVREVADAAARHGLALGIYLSPWDRKEATYGSGAAYDDYFVAQLEELLTGYGDVFSVWFDGANGEGPNGKVQEYDWDRYYEVIRRLQPGAVINVCGPDVRWCGNEAGHTRANEWSVVPAELRDVERIAERSQQADDGEFPSLVRSDDADLGSRQALRGREFEAVWYPAEVNTSNRPGWFHHPAEDSQVKPAEELFEVWWGSVGGNATMLLNVPPNAEGLVADPDVVELSRLGHMIGSLQAAVIPASATASSGAVTAGGPSGAPLGVAEPFAGQWREPAWVPADHDDTPQLTLHFTGPQDVSAVVLREDIRYGQRLEDVRISAQVDGTWKPVARIGAVGYQRLARFDPVVATAVRIEVRKTRAVPVLRAAAAIAVP